MLNLDQVEVALAVSAISLTVTKASVLQPVRDGIKAGNALLGKLVSCPYCAAHWFAFSFSFFLPVVNLNSWFVSVFSILAMAAIFMGIAIKLLHIDQAYIEHLEELIDGKDQ